MIDTTIRFNDHNSYKVTTPLFCYPFGVEDMTHITHSFQAYATSSLASATRARTKFFDANGATISDVSHSFAVTTVFGKVEITVAVPATAAQAQLVLLQGGTDWWIAEPKSEQGELATPYNVNYAGQLTYITPNGIYTGMLTASQIVVTGSINQSTEHLETRLVTINNNAINLSSTVSGHGTRLTTVEAGQITLAATDTAQGNRLTLIEAGQITISGSATYAAGYDPTTKETPAGAQARVNALAATLGDLAYEDLVEAAKLGTTIIVGGYIKTGLVSASNINVGTLSADRIAAGSLSGLKLADGTVSDIKIASGLSATKITVGTLSADRIAAKAITGAKLADGTVDTLQIAASAITAEKIAAGTITADKINVSNLFAQNITATGSITGAKLFGATISNSSFATHQLKVGSNLAVIGGSDYYYSGLALFDTAISSTVPIFSALGVNGDIYLQKKAGVNFLFTNHNGVFLINDSYDSELSLHNDEAELSYGTGMYNAIGADATGPYYIKNGSAKQYF